jgi:hypothetical protein
MGNSSAEYQREYNRKYYLKNKLYLNESGKNYYSDINKRVFDILGRVCVRCNESELEFLTVDHIHNDRKQERHYNSNTWKRDIVNGKVDLHRYQTLCRNCNEAKQRLNPVNLLKTRIPTGLHKVCSSCGFSKDTSEFSTSSYRGIRCVDSSCHICVVNDLRSITIRCYKLLGGSCMCCGISDTYKLNIDHINNDGAECRKNGERTGVVLCRQILNGVLDLNRFQLLCANCNYSKLLHGVCIHSMKVAA